MNSRVLAFVICLVLGLAALPAKAGENALPPNTPPGGWPEQSVTGAYNRAALQRGYQVYAQVCSTCHSLKLLSYRDLTQLGFSQAEVKAIASNFPGFGRPERSG